MKQKRDIAKKNKCCSYRIKWLYKQTSKNHCNVQYIIECDYKENK